MTNPPIDVSDSYDAQVAIPPQLLAKLIRLGVLHGDECRCLNATAKQVLWQSLLNCSLYWDK